MDDLRNTWRQWRRTPLVTTLAALSLTLGIGGNLALFSLVDALVLRTLPIAAPETLVRFVTTDFRPGEIRDIAVPTHV